jgi:hypothetical protein
LVLFSFAAPESEPAPASDQACAAWGSYFELVILKSCLARILNNSNTSIKLSSGEVRLEILQGGPSAIILIFPLAKSTISFKLTL